MNQNRNDRDVRNREEQIEDMTRRSGSSVTEAGRAGERGAGASDDTSGTGSSGERNRDASTEGEDKATGISNRGLGREIDEQHRVPDRGTSKSEE